MASTSKYSTFDPIAQASTASSVLLAGSVIDMARYRTLSFTIKNTGANSIDWLVKGGNLPDLSDGATVNNSATIAAGAFGTPYAPATTPYRYYGIFIVDTVGASHGAATVHAIAKE